MCSIVNVGCGVSKVFFLCALTINNINTQKTEARFVVEMLAFYEGSKFAIGQASVEMESSHNIVESEV